MINVEVLKSGNESNANLIRRFTKRVQGSGVLNRVRGIRYSLRPTTKFAQKKKALNSLSRKEKITQLIKLGKMVDKTRKGK